MQSFAFSTHCLASPFAHLNLLLLSESQEKCGHIVCLVFQHYNYSCNAASSLRNLFLLDIDSLGFDCVAGNPINRWPPELSQFHRH